MAKCYPLNTKGWNKALHDLHKQQGDCKSYIIATGAIGFLFVAGIINIGFIENYIACSLTSKVVKRFV